LKQCIQFSANDKCHLIEGRWKAITWL